MSRNGRTDRHGHRSGGELVQEFITQWLALSGDAWLALGGVDDVRRALIEAVSALVPARGPESPRRVIAWATDELAALDLPGLCASLGCEYVGWNDWPSGPDAPGAPQDSSPEGPANGPGATGAAWSRRRNLAAASDLGITTCAWAVADTGTIALYATSSSGRLPSLLPTAHVALVRPSQIVRSVPDGLRRMAEHRAQQGGPPSAVNLVSGPSRSADIEGDLAVGVHGPQRAGVVIGEW
jgi:L-lactate dehydrogenase complex protein LldG